MGDKRRATQHNGRKGKKGAFSPKHNDRDYDYEEAANIHADLTEQNFYWNTYNGSYRHKDKKGKMSFEQVEQTYYRDNFYEQWEATNQRYINNRHSERCKTFEEWSKMSCNLPEESYMQIGDMENPCDRATATKVFTMFYHRINAWNDTHGKPFKNLDLAMHFDEAVPQVHIRRVWEYTDKNGVKCIGQEKALEQAGVQLPDPSKKKGRYNNRKMTFDKMAREMYLQCCKECGLEIETVPVPNTRHNMDKDEMIAEKVKNQFKEQEQETAVKLQQADDTLKQAINLRDEALNLVMDCKRLNDGLNNQTARELYDKQISKRESRLEALNESLLRETHKTPENAYLTP